MQFHPKDLFILVGVGVPLSMAVASNGGTWFHFGEVVSTVVILVAWQAF